MDRSSDNRTLRRLLPVFILIEILIIVLAYLQVDSLQEMFRLSARWSGRFSLIVFTICIVVFSQRKDHDLNETRQMVVIFAVLHFIHLFLLSMNVQMNKIQLIPYKLAGGALAYLMILVYPFIIYKIRKDWLHLLYFLYISFVMAMTYVARIKGDFEGAEAKVFHDIGLGISAGAGIYLLFKFFSRRAFPHEER